MNLRNALAAAAFCVLPALVQAQGMSQWGRAGGWAIKIDDQLNNGCLFEKRFGSGVLVRFGIDRSRNESYMTAFTHGWGDIRVGERYPIGYLLDNNSYPAYATGLNSNGVPGADITFSHTDVLFQIAASNSMTLYNEVNDNLLTISLRGTQAALNATLACQDAMG